MTLENLRAHVMFQTNNDEDDLEEFQPAVDNYLNEGYNRLVEAYARTYLDTPKDDGTTPYPSLVNSGDTPLIPAWAHRAIGDYATYCVYRNGNIYKQQRGEKYLQMFMDVLNKLRGANDDLNKSKGKDGIRHFYNLYTD